MLSSLLSLSLCACMYIFLFCFSHTLSYRMLPFLVAYFIIYLLFLVDHCPTPQLYFLNRIRLLKHAKICRCQNENHPATDKSTLHLSELLKTLKRQHTHSLSLTHTIQRNKLLTYTSHWNLIHWRTHTQTHTLQGQQHACNASPLPSLSARSPSPAPGVRDGIKWEREWGWRRRRGRRDPVAKRGGATAGCC